MAEPLARVEPPDLRAPSLWSLGLHVALAWRWRLAAAGARVVLTARSNNELHHALAEIESIGGHGLAVPADISDPAAVTSLVDHAHANVGPFSMLVTAAAGASQAWQVVGPKCRSPMERPTLPARLGWSAWPRAWPASSCGAA
jgi:NAD(P)-dependent dehydrogenase (short-subunit alcohol dehydrogenase family)